MIPEHLRHFFFSSLEQGLTAQNESAGGQTKTGKIKSVGFIIPREGRATQKVKFETYEGSSVLTDQEKEGLCQVCGINLKDEMRGVKTIFVLLKFETKKIYIEKVKEEGPSVKIEI